ncbi:Gfo/Idh/MocA family protein [Jiangella alkaliphila]|uniref:Oxidoreductase family, C-terminal alpha/beta domain n=1 Tax=Jiangella alkaliphila TaxID=419479 RepID=A0A1H2K4T5_9ACTN|nr:Gfo/Idh/MocA family oxidoreductase [Jiangella alkaliphila]SDU63408.1 Oxidoreductase family, C-terminal alpha/beta domain [Jiangella alkaliphila]
MEDQEQIPHPHLRLGIIGAGSHSSNMIYPNLHALPAELVAVCDLDADRASRNARRFGGQHFTDHTEMLDRAELDAVIVCVGPKEHARLSVEVMEAGLPVYTEKPPAASAADARTVLEASRRTGQPCMTAFMKRFAPAYQKAHAAIVSPEFGAPSLLTIDSGLGLVHEDPSWLLFDFSIHVVDLARFLFGEVSEVYARTQQQIAYATTLIFANGAVGNVAVSAHRQGTITEEVEITGGFGDFITISDGSAMMRHHDNRVVDWHERPYAEIGYRLELAEFVSAIHEGREPESSIASSYQTMRLCEAIDLSAKERRPVVLDEIH